MKITIDQIINNFFYLEILLNKEDIKFFKETADGITIENKADVMRLFRKYRDCLKETRRGQIVINHFIYSKTTMIHIDQEQLHITVSCEFSSKERDTLAKNLRLNYERGGY